jgi:hypothetical protein
MPLFQKVIVLSTSSFPWRAPWSVYLWSLCPTLIGFDLSRQHQNSVKTKSSNVLIPSWGVTILRRLLPRYALHAFYSYLYAVCPSEFWESHNRDVCNKKITIDHFASYVSWFQANVLTEISVVSRNWGQRLRIKVFCLVSCLVKFWADYYILSTPTVVLVKSVESYIS